MTYTPGFLYDVYISDLADEQDYFGALKPLVKDFEEKLKVELDKRLGGKVSIYRREVNQTSSDRPNSAI